MIRKEKGQATTEVVLLFPLFLFFLFAFAKIFALLILLQKLEIASFYAARRWQLESHRNVNYEQPDDIPGLQNDIAQYACTYLGYDGSSANLCRASSSSSGHDWGFGNTAPASVANFLGLAESCPTTKDCSEGKPGVAVTRAQVWNVVTVTACTKPLNLAFYQAPSFTFCSTKYVPNRDRPIAFILPGLQQ